MKVLDKWNKEILNIALPSIISNLTVPLLGLADLVVIGHIGDATYISAISIGTMIFNVMYWLLGFLRMGTSGLTSQSFGRNNYMDCLEVLSRSLIIGVGLGFLFLILQKPIGWGMLSLMNTPPTSWSFVSSYFYIVIWGAPATLGLYTLNGWYIGMQNTRIPMLIALIQNVVNIAASLCFVFLFNLNIEGVALGTLVAQWVGFIVALAGIKKCFHSMIRASELTKKSFFSLIQQAFKGILSKQGKWIEFFMVNKDIFLRTLCLVAVNFFFTSAGGKQGTLILAVNTLLMTFFTIFSYVMDGFAYAGEALSGKYYGGRNFSALRIIMHRLFVFGFVMALIFTLLYVLGGTSFLHLLTSDNAVVQAAHPYLLWASFIPLCGLVAFVLDGVFIGLTFTKGMLLSTFAAMSFFFLTYYSLSNIFHNHALWASFLVFLAIRGATSLVWLRYKRFIFN